MSDKVTQDEPSLYDEVEKDDTTPEDIVKSNMGLFSVDVLVVIKEAQTQHGLRHGDYLRYHGYCNRRLKRIRNVIKFKMGDKKRVTPKKVTENIFTDPRYILMILMTSERAWSLAMHFKQEANSKPRKRHHMVNKMRRAVKHAIDLNDLCENCDKVDARTKLEAQAYCLYMKGVLAFELKDWVSAMELFRKTQTIYRKLSEAMPKEEQSTYLNMVEEISPNIRYCAYTIGDQSAIDDLIQIYGSGRQDPLLAGKLDSLIAESRGTKAASMSETTWRGRVIRVKNNKVRLFLIGIKEFAKDFSMIDSDDRDAQIEMYDRVLTECKDALQCTRDDMRTDPHSKPSKERGGNVSNLQFLNSYLTFLRLAKTIQRNLLLVGGLKTKASQSLLTGGNPEESGAGDAGKKAPKPTDFMRLYDSILQGLSEVRTLPGVEDDSVLQEEIKAQNSAFQAFRCFYVAQAYVKEKKYAEGMALYDRVLEYANAALKAFQTVEVSDEFDFVNASELENLIETIAFNRYRVHASAVLDGVQEDKKDDVDLTIPLMDRLDVYYEDPVVSSLVPNKPNSKIPPFTSAFPPSFEAIPCKPLFFDLALNHVAFPSLEGKLGQKPGQPKAGLSGLISNLWGWGGKK